VVLAHADSNAYPGRHNGWRSGTGVIPVNPFALGLRPASHFIFSMPTRARRNQPIAVVLYKDYTLAVTLYDIGKHGGRKATRPQGRKATRPQGHTAEKRHNAFQGEFDRGTTALRSNGRPQGRKATSPYDCLNSTPHQTIGTGIPTRIYSILKGFLPWTLSSGAAMTLISSSRTSRTSPALTP
jgi:hypothetical protein